MTKNKLVCKFREQLDLAKQKFKNTWFQRTEYQQYLGALALNKLYLQALNYIKYLV